MKIFSNLKFNRKFCLATDLSGAWKALLTCLLIGFPCCRLYGNELQVIPEDSRYCTVCHGTLLKGNAITQAPGLAGLPKWYVENQLKAFQQAWRGSHDDDYSGAEMFAVARNFDEKKIQYYSNFVVSIPKSDTHQSDAISGDIENGEKLYQHCATCHGQSAEGNRQLQAPPLLVQGDWYLKKQLLAFKQGLRGVNHADSLGQTMVVAVSQLSQEDEINDVVAYIATLSLP